MPLMQFATLPTQRNINGRNVIVGEISGGILHFEHKFVTPNCWLITVSALTNSTKSWWTREVLVLSAINQRHVKQYKVMFAICL